MRQIPKTVLVLGDDSRSTLDIVRSLGSKGVRVILGFEDPNSMVRYSRFVDSGVKLPSSAARLEEWKSEVKKLLLSRRFDLVIPSVESTYLALALHRSEFINLAPLALPDENGFEHTYLKDKTLALAKQLQIPLPCSFVIENRNDLLAIQDKLEYPVVIKPIVSKVWVDGYRLELGVKVAYTPAEFEEKVSRWLLLLPTLVQSYFKGIGIGQEFLCKDGKVFLSFQHERVHEPMGSGGSSFRKSSPMHPRMFSCSQKLLSNLKWTGVAMVEYRWNPETDQFVFVEVNGRFWGSLPLATRAGVNFPYALYELLVLGKTPLQPRYSKEIYARNLVKDFQWFLESLNTEKGKSSLLRPIYFLQYITAVFLRFVLQKDHWDTFWWCDPLPAFKEAFNLVKVFSFKSLKRILNPVHNIKYMFKSVDEERKKVLALLQKNPNVLFVCWGNVARSPFAEAYLKSKTQTSSFSLEVGSAGVYSQGGRPAYPYAKMAARKFGVSLKNHRSRVLTGSLVRSSGVILCMGTEEFKVVRKKFPDARNKTFLLGRLYGGGRRISIADPWGKGVEVYEDVFRVIKECVDSLCTRLCNR